MIILSIAALCLFVSIFSILYVVVNRKASGTERLSAAILPPHLREADEPGLSVDSTVSSIRAVVSFFQRLVPRTEQDLSIVKTRLIRAGFRGSDAISIYFGTKALTPLLFCMLATFVVDSDDGSFFFYAMALGLGYLAPDFWLGARIKARQEKIRLALADVLDLLVVCIEAGLSIDIAIARTTSEVANLHKEISEELRIVILEQRAGRGRAEAWRSFADRTNVDAIRALASVLIQADRFGTSVTRALRAHSETLRTQRRQQLEELASKTTVKLVFPLVLFIFPAMFVVLMGPSMITLLDSFSSFL